MPFFLGWQGCLWRGGSPRTKRIQGDNPYPVCWTLLNLWNSGECIYLAHNPPYKAHECEEVWSLFISKKMQTMLWAYDTTIYWLYSFINDQLRILKTKFRSFLLFIRFGLFCSFQILLLTEHCYLTALFAAFWVTSIRISWHL